MVFQLIRRLRYIWKAKTGLWVSGTTRPLIGRTDGRPKNVKVKRGRFFWRSLFIGPDKSTELLVNRRDYK